MEYSLVCLAQRNAVSTHYFSERSRAWHVGMLNKSLLDEQIILLIPTVIL